MADVKLPNFFVVGAQKSGTTSLYYYLSQHPEIYMSPIKEPHFFDYDEGETPVFGGPSVPPPGITSMREYRALFEGATDEVAVGEASPTYLYLPGVAQRLRCRVPGARVIAVLRDPAERAYSAFLHTVRSGREPLNSFSRALGEEEGRIRENWHPLYHYRSRGFYHGQIERYLKAFGRDRVKVYLYEDLRDEPLRVLQDAFRFLGADASFVPDVSTRYNASGVPRNRAVSAVVKRANTLTPALKKVLPFAARQRIKGRLFAKAPPLRQDDRRELVEGYRGDILKLQNLLNRDLSKWLR